MSHPLHEVEITTGLVRRLLADQYPALAELDLQVTARGWDNVTVRIGADLAARLPARALAAPLVEHEQRWLPAVAPQLPVPVPVPVHTGRPGHGYPWAWSVVPWFAGTPADAVSPTDRDEWAGDLAAALAALHTPALDGAPTNPVRGVPMRTRDQAIRARLAAVPGPDGDTLVKLWSDGLAAPEWPGPAVWLHGDPHPANLLTDDHSLVALIDFGDITAGDPASDLATAWLCFGFDAREHFWQSYAEHTGLDRRALDDLRRRARAWAATLVPVMGAHPDEHPGLAAVGTHALVQLRAEHVEDRQPRGSNTEARNSGHPE